MIVNRMAGCGAELTVPRTADQSFGDFRILSRRPNSYVISLDTIIFMELFSGLILYGYVSELNSSLTEALYLEQKTLSFIPYSGLMEKKAMTMTSVW